MTRKLKKSVWPYNHFFKYEEENDLYMLGDEHVNEREDWLIKNFNENILDRVYIIESSKGVHYYFKNEEDYKWFLWRWV